MKPIWHVCLSVSLLLPALAGCTPNTFEWKEEILLHDGRKIIAERKDVAGGWTEPGQSGSTQKRTITFPDPNDPKKKYTHQITGSSNYLLLDFEKGVPWLIVSVGPFSVNTDCPIGSYETFTQVNGAWRSVSYSELPKAFANPNMSVTYTPDMPDPRRKGKVLSAEEIQALLASKKRVLAGATGTTWRLVQKNDHGRPIDCQAYPAVKK
ncbi:hypothetical protein M4R22_06170 [Acidovorax sp. GBBC 3334]|uniref:hypothetical protein n=1 Tax=Acidovorax sp. GBBC 3334 TaxID=2940496 RepID=UPI002304CCD2|nr:hypothetical protein [Acidovorax sp. GBBC 3334]MDA8454341.1 hypothetical protein [Acidovorax sp. GBBC 3334]